MIHSNLAAQVAAIVLGPLQFGLHMAELNAPLPYIDCTQIRGDCIQGFGDGASASSAFAIGGLIGSLLGGSGADKYGRLRSLQLFSGIFLLGSLIACISHANPTLVAGRFVSGLAAGGSIVVAPIFIQEISPRNYRGLLGACTQISVNLGILLTQFFGVLWALHSWRRILWLGPLCAAMQFLCFSKSVESPKWLEQRGEVVKAREAAAYLGLSQEGQEEHLGDNSAHNSHPPIGVKKYLALPKYRYSLLVATGVMTLQQFSGINAIIFYGVSILKESVPRPELVNFGLSLLNLAFTILSARFIDRLGRRALLVFSLLGMALGTSLLGFSLIGKVQWLSVVASSVVIVTFAMGLGPIPFMLIGEYTPREASGIAQSVGTTFNWLATFAIGAFFPKVERALGPGVWYIFASICILGAAVLKRTLDK